MNKTFIKELQESKFFPYLFNNQDVVAIYLGGSRSNHICDELSDYDIIVLTKDSLMEEESLFKLEYKGVTVHWYYRSLEQILNCWSTQNTRLSYISGINFLNMEENLIYANPEHQNLVDFIFNYKKEIVNYCCWEFVLSSFAFWNAISTEKISQDNYNKYLYHLMICNCILFDKEFDIELLNKIKRIGYTEDAENVLKNELDTAYQYIQELNEYRLTHDLKREETREYLLGKLKEVN